MMSYARPQPTNLLRDATKPLGEEKKVTNDRGGKTLKNLGRGRNEEERVAKFLPKCLPFSDCRSFIDEVTFPQCGKMPVRQAPSRAAD